MSKCLVISIRSCVPALLLLGLTACGRLGFEPESSDAGAPSTSGKSIVDAAIRETAIESPTEGFDATQAAADVAASATPDAGLVADVPGAVDLKLDLPLQDGPVADRASIDTMAPPPVDAALAGPIDTAIPDAPAPIVIDAQPPDTWGVQPIDVSVPIVIDAATPDGPDPIDAAVPDTQPDLATACGAGISGLLFCEDFENGLPVPVPNYGYTTSPNGSVTLANTIVRSGTNAAHLRVGDVAMPYNVRQANFYQRFSSPITQGNIYLRMFFYMPSDFTAPPWNVVLELAQANDGSQRIKASQEANDAFGFSINTAKNEYAYRGPNLYQRNSWHCLEIAVKLGNGNSGSAEYFLDGQSKAVFPAANTSTPGGWAGTQFGAICEPSGVGVNMYIDDIAIATSPIGCN